MNKFEVTFGFIRDSNSWINTLFDDFHKTEHLYMIEYMREDLNLTATSRYVSERNRTVFTIYFDSEADAIAFILARS